MRYKCALDAIDSLTVNKISDGSAAFEVHESGLTSEIILSKEDISHLITELKAGKKEHEVKEALNNGRRYLVLEDITCRAIAWEWE